MLMLQTRCFPHGLLENLPLAVSMSHRMAPNQKHEWTALFRFASARSAENIVFAKRHKLERKRDPSGRSGWPHFAVWSQWTKAWCLDVPGLCRHQRCSHTSSLPGPTQSPKVRQVIRHVIIYLSAVIEEKVRHYYNCLQTLIVAYVASSQVCYLLAFALNYLWWFQMFSAFKLDTS